MTVGLRSVHPLVLLHSLERLFIHALAPVANGALDFVRPVDGNDGHKTERDEFPAFARLARHVVAVGAVVSLGFMAFPGVAKVLGWVSKQKEYEREERSESERWKVTTRQLMSEQKRAK